ncbi:MAG: DUF2283 domain-containing protein [Candidatus Freyarchaeota archaeon]
MCNYCPSNEEADVLYINFKKPSHSDDSELTAIDVILRYEKGELVRITVLNASKRKIKKIHDIQWGVSFFFVSKTSRTSNSF